jgi:hypothetical protein
VDSDAPVSVATDSTDAPPACTTPPTCKRQVCPCPLDTRWAQPSFTVVTAADLVADAPDLIEGAPGGVGQGRPASTTRYSAVNVVLRHVRCPTLQKWPNRPTKIARSRSIRVGVYGPLLH